MRTATKTGVLFTYPDANVWKQERLLIYCSRQSGSATTVYLSSSLGAHDIAAYTLDASGKCIIDVTDYVRAEFTNGVSKYIYLDTNLAASTGDAQGVDMKIIGLIAPESVIKPTNPIAPLGATIVPPLMYYAKAQDIVEGEFYTSANSGSWSTSGEATMAANVRNIGQIGGNYSIVRNSSTVQRYKVRAMNDCRRYALVRWVSFTGAQRVHWFETRKQTIASAEKYSLLTPDNSYCEIKGREDAFTLYLDKLCRYDLWYYGDVITSSKVEMSFDGSIWVQVEVATKNNTLPDGDTDGKLEIDVKYKQYDAAAM